MRPDEARYAPMIYLSVRVWNEALFAYEDGVIHASKVGVKPELIHSPPLCYVTAVRTY